MIIDNNSLKDIKYITLALENCEDFDIQSKYILDIRFGEINTEAGDTEKKKVNDGRLLLSNDCLDLLSNFLG